MAYAMTDYPTKKALREAVQRGDEVRIYSHAGIFPPKTDGQETLEGPHYPKPHTWYASVTMRDGLVVKVK